MKLPAARDLEVRGLEAIEPAFAQFNGTMHAGLLPTDNGNRTGQMMFWLFEEKNSPKNIILWLNGGPGCSSFNCGVLMEISPVTQPQHNAGYCCLKPEPNFYVNENTWAHQAALLFVEQPIGTGFSFGHPYPETEHDVGKDLDAFLQNFYEVFPHMKHYGFYVMGESYAGMFVPSVARHFHLENKKAIADKDHSRILVPLKGASLGNGWIDAKIQGPATIDYSWWHGLIDKPTRDALHIEWENCMAGQTTGAPFHLFNIQDDCGMMWGVLKAAGNPNAYDVSTWDPNVDQVTFASEVFYNNPQVKAMLHAPNGTVWHGCGVGAGRRRLNEQQRRLYMDNDRPMSVVQYIAELVDDGIPVLIYNGDRDMTTNMVGTELALNGMEWSGKDEWLDADRGLWMVDGAEAGWVKEHGNLSFLTVYNSGHMVPYNVPGPASNLVTRVLAKHSFLDVLLPLVRSEKLSGTQASVPAIDFLASTIGLPAMHPEFGMQWHTITVAFVSMIIGYVLAILTVRRERGYQRI